MESYSINSQLIDILKKESKELGIGFLHHFGFREFYCDGSTIGISSNNDWNNALRDLEFKTEVEKHYFPELLQVINENVRYIIRTRDQASNNFQRKLLTVNMSNSLIIYKVFPNFIRGYFFISSPEDSQALVFFVNNLYRFNSVTGIMDDILSKNNFLVEELISEKFQLFSPEERDRIFGTKKQENIANFVVVVNERQYEFTPKEIEFLKVVKYGCAVKEIAKSLNVSPRTAEWHLSNIKLKLHTSSKLDVTKFAQLADFT